MTYQIHEKKKMTDSGPSNNLTQIFKQTTEIMFFSPEALTVISICHPEHCQMPRGRLRHQGISSYSKGNLLFSSIRW